MKSVVRRSFGVSLLGLLIAAPASAAYVDLVNSFAQIRNDTVFPVPTRSANDLESAFGPRMQTSTGLYDFHRGVDIDGGASVGVENVVAVLDGTFYDYRFSTSGGNTVILKHELPAPVTYQGKSITSFYTWYLHLYDDGIEGNGIGTADLVAGLNVGDAVPQSTVIGKLGDSGSPSSGSYTPHLHFELRIATPSSLEFQLANPGTTQWGFDPHMNPLLLFPPGTYGGPGAGDYTQQLALAAPVAMGQDIRLDYLITNDDQPLWNQFEFLIKQQGTGTVMASHVLDLNQRVGYDATSTAALDSRDLTKPYLDPVDAALGGTEFTSELVLPSVWTQGYQNGGYELTVNATDLWGNLATFTAQLAPVPEPAEFALVAGAGLALFAGWRRVRS